VTLPSPIAAASLSAIVALSNLRNSLSFSLHYTGINTPILPKSCSDATDNVHVSWADLVLSAISVRFSSFLSEDLNSAYPALVSERMNRGAMLLFA
jgi:hypothetical protein